VARSSHFEVYAQSGPAAARAALARFEQLRAFLERQAGIAPEGRVPLRIIGFRSAKEYEQYRLSPESSAYYVGTEGRGHIVLPSVAAGEFANAAHEYAHAVMHAGGYRFPPWLNEGLAEFFSTVEIGERASTIGGDRPGRSHVFRPGEWIPLERLLEEGGESQAFYSESRLLLEMAALSAEYAPRFPLLMARLAGGAPGGEALTSVYSRPLASIERDLRAWSAKSRPAPLPLPGVPPAAVGIEVREAPPYEVRGILAELLAAIGALDRAEREYRALSAERPSDADAFAALGGIALRRGDTDGARREWRRAIALGVKDPTLCYRYAALASMAGLPEAEIRPALERTLELQPEYDDARFQLALMEKNAGEHAAAVEDLRKMGPVAPARAYVYWSALADALNGLGDSAGAVDAAHKAADWAVTSEDRRHAGELAYIAETELSVRMTQAADGTPRAVATRIPRGTSAEWNPFIDPSDDVRRVSGNLREIDCGGAVTRFVLEAASGTLALALPDLKKLQARNAPAEFTCGPQTPAAAVIAVYAAGKPAGVEADGVLRGIEFR
jgi:tetratricopeptide (TPR) repeat protein